VKVEFESRPYRRIRAFRGRFGFGAALMVVAVLAGCGGGSNDEDLTKTDYIIKADAICARYSANSATLESQFDQALKTSDLEAAAQDFEDQASDVTTMLDELEKLTAPASDQATVDQIIALGRKRVDVAKQAADAIASGDKETMIASGKKASVLAGEYFELADGFGFKACGSSGAETGATGATGSTGTTGTTS
jgi:hypothetical protein